MSMEEGAGVEYVSAGDEVILDRYSSSSRRDRDEGVHDSDGCRERISDRYRAPTMSSACTRSALDAACRGLSGMRSDGGGSNGAWLDFLKGRAVCNGVGGRMMQEVGKDETSRALEST
jgi:hypothetical protein